MDITSFSAFVAAISVIIGVIFFIFQMRDADKYRHAGLIIQLNPALKTKPKEVIDALSEIWHREFKDYDEYLKKYGDPISDKAFFTVVEYYNALGFLLHRKLIDVDIIEYLVNDSSIGVWEKMKPLMDGMRSQYKIPKLYQWFEYLQEEIEKRMKNV